MTCQNKQVNDGNGKKLTVIVQLCGPCDQHKEEKRCKAKSHAEQLCETERNRREREEQRGKRKFSNFKYHSISHVDCTLHKHH